MAISHEFGYERPATIEEAVKLLAENGAKARVLAGGTDLTAWLRDDLVRPDLLVDIKGLAGLRGVTSSDGDVTIGALATFSDLLDSDLITRELPVISEMAKTIASCGIRNRATVVGNICSAVPSCDAGPVLMVFEATVEVVGPQGRRSVPICDWFVGPQKTVLCDDEIVVNVKLPIPEMKHGGCFVKLGRYNGADLAQASVCILCLQENNYRVSLGAVASTPVRGRKIEALMNGKSPDDALIEDAKKIIRSEISPITDIRASEQYRSRMVRVMFERGVRAAAARLRGTGPSYGTNLI